MLTVYVESTIPSYLAAFPSRDLVTSAHQQITHDWWLTAREQFELVISPAVIAEISAGDAKMASRRHQLLLGLRSLVLDKEVRDLFGVYRQHLALPKRAYTDLLHVAFAVRYEIDYLVTWNCAHIANGQIVRQLNKINDVAGRSTPLIVTPEELQQPPLQEE